MEYLIQDDFPVIYAPTEEQFVAMQESGRRIALEIEARIDPMFCPSVEDMFFIHD